MPWAGRQAGRQPGRRRAVRQPGGRKACIISHRERCMHGAQNSTTLPLPHSLPQSQQLQQMLCLIGFWLGLGQEQQEEQHDVFAFAFAFTTLPAWPAAGKRPKCMLFRLNCRFSQTSPATVCHVCGSYITAIYAANGMPHSGTDTQSNCMYVCMYVCTYLKLLSSL